MNSLSLLRRVSSTSKYLIGLCAILILPAGCAKKQAVVMPPVKVNVVKAIQGDVPLYEDFVAQVYGQSDVGIRSRVEGWVI